MTNKLTALFFDVDGTLSETEEIHRLAFNTAFSEAGLHWSWDQDLYKKLLQVTGGKERIRFFIDQYPQDIAVPGALDDFIAQLHARKTEIYIRMLADGEVALRPGIERLIKQAHNEGLRLAIVTTTSPENVVALLERGFNENVVHWFDVVAAGNVVQHKKPAPDIYNYALEKMNLPGEQCLAVEDSLNGQLSARAAGINAIIAVDRYTEDQEFTPDVLVLDHLGEPGMPCKALQGDLQPDGMVDTAFLRRLHDHYISSTVHEQGKRAL